MLLGLPRLRLWVWVAVLGSAATAIGIAWISAERIGIERLHDTGTHKLDLYSASLESALAKYDYLPGVVGLRPEVVALLRSPAAPGLRQSVNLYLAQVNTEARSAVLYVLDTHGLTIAASNWNEEASFVGMDLSYRPYLHDAIERGAGRFYGIGTTSGKPGFYYSQAIRDHDEVIGVAVVKVSLDHVERAWSGGGDIALVVDASGVVFLASDPVLKFKTLGSLQPAAAAAIEKSRQYAGVGLAPLGLAQEAPAIGDARIVALGDGNSRKRYLELGHPTPEPTWRLYLLSDYSPVMALVRNTVAFTAVALAFVFLLVLYLYQRRRTIHTSLAAKAALQRAHDELERKVAERTIDLVAANKQLGREVAERQRAEHVLREAQDGLVQAGKMAVLGQMAAGITHELNQPLAALRTLSDNARVLLAKARTDDVQNNLTLISQLTERMAKITGQLKAFARKSALQLGPVSVRRALGNVQALLEQRLRTEHVAIIEDWSEDDVDVRADANRLEQVLVNLIVNALDAMQGATTRRLEVSVREKADRVSITVRDTGPGIAPALLPRIFEPFVTTKEPGAGLGLGLAISVGIIREFGGSLVAANRPQGGAEFTIELASAMETNDA
jgi:two-component system C4-dicarboxylate transport sensor histidine kinase DctB